MYFRKKVSGGRTYLLIVESRREDDQVRQQVIATLGRVDELQASGQLERLLRSGARFAAKAMVLSAASDDAIKIQCTSRAAADRHSVATPTAKDHRPDLRQMILAVLIDGDGHRVRSEMWPGNTADVTTLIPVLWRSSPMTRNQGSTRLPPRIGLAAEARRACDLAAYLARMAIKLIFGNHSAHISKETKAGLPQQPASPRRICLHSQARLLAEPRRRLFSTLARSVLRHIRVVSKQDRPYLVQ
jgi:hypothetical protein